MRSFTRWAASPIPLAATFVVFGHASSASGETRSEPSRLEAPSSTHPPVQEDPIVVVAPRSTSSSIDSTVYTIRKTPEADVLTALEILRRVPFVSVSDDGQVQILGRSGVKILIDGNEVSDVTTLLRNLRANRLKAVEVVTNPSARYSADARAGVINLRLRRDAPEHLSGTISASGGSRGGLDISLSPSVSLGETSVVATTLINRNVQEQDSGIRRFPAAGSNKNSEMSEESKIRSATTSPFAQATLTHPVGKDRRLIIDVVAATSHTVRDTHVVSLLDSGQRDEHTIIGFDNYGGSLTYEAGDEEKSYLKVRGGLSGSDSKTTLSAIEAGSRDFNFSGREIKSDWSVSVDRVKQLRASHRLRFGGGAGWHVENRSSAFTFRPVGDVGEDGFRTEGDWREAFLYGDYQFSVGKGRVLLGLRGEQRTYDLTDDVGIRRRYNGLFPSVHLERPLSPRTKFRASYSRRVSWPNLSDLNPLIRFIDSVTASGGNPFLQPENVDSFELSVQGQRRGGTELGAAVYYRNTQRLFSILAELNGDVLIYRPVNAGHSASYGASAFARGKIVPGLTYDLSGSLFHEQQTYLPSIGFGPRTSSLRGVAALQLEYNEMREQKPGADTIHLDLNYQSKAIRGLMTTAPEFSLGGSWTHQFTKRLSTVLTISGIELLPLRPISYHSPDGTFSQFDRSRRPVVRLAVTAAFGAQ